MLTVHLIAPQKAMKISSGKAAGERNTLRWLCSGQFLRSAPALKLITAPKCCFGGWDQQHGEGVLAVLPCPRHPWQLSARGHSFHPTRDFSQEVGFAVPSPRGTAHHTHAASLACSKESPPASWATRTNFVRSTPPISNIRSNWSGVQYLLPGIHVY